MRIDLLVLAELFGTVDEVREFRTCPRSGEGAGTSGRMQAVARASLDHYALTSNLRQRRARPFRRCASAAPRWRRVTKVAATEGAGHQKVTIAAPDPSAFAPDGGRLFCFGLGYTSLGLVNTLKRAGWVVSGTCRDASKVASLREAGVDAHVWRPDDAVRLDSRGIHAVLAATHVLNSVPPNGDFDRDPVLADAACMDALRAGKEAGTLRWLGYLSSTGVYGEHRGAWVDEGTPCAPASPVAKRRANAEREWLASDLNAVLRVFRLGGIYGPGRSVLDAVAREARGREDGSGVSQESLSRRGRLSRAFTARAHVGDVVNCLCASVWRSGIAGAEEGDSARVYNIVDDDPAPRRDAEAHARFLLGIPESAATSKEDTPEENVNAGSAASGPGEKRVANHRIKRDLGVTLVFPTYREGLEAIARGERIPFE